MKTPFVVVIAALTILPSFGQYSARSLTRRIAPQTQPAPARQAPARPAATAVAPANPANSAKIAAQKSKAERDLLAWQKRRAEAGSDNAQYELGIRYLTGKGVEKDEKVGRQWLRKAAKSGNVQAQKKLKELKDEGEELVPKPVAKVPAANPKTEHVSTSGK